MKHKRRSTGPSTEEAILDAAETLIGKHGLDGVSMRQIGAAAGCGNVAAVQYHFKNRERLVEAIFERRLVSLETKRRALLAELERTGEQNNARALLEVLLAPAADERDMAGRRSYAAFLLGIRVFSGLPEQWSGTRQTAPMTHRTYDLLRAALSEQPVSLFRERLLAAFTVFLSAVSDLARQEELSGPSEKQARTIIARALDFGFVGLIAPAGI